MNCRERETSGRNGRTRRTHKKKCERIRPATQRKRSPKRNNDFTLLNAALHMLQTSIQSLIDVSARLLSELGEKPPATYGELPQKLSENKVLSHSETLNSQKGNRIQKYPSPHIPRREHKHCPKNTEGKKISQHTKNSTKNPKIRTRKKDRPITKK
ncbi:MAG: DUF86 domain-containing protein [Candidatus Freyarchaeota archaeon]|nr:DUF86 domain-containing protein [Candidatus Jordarchaeia archaeon]